MTGWDRHSGTAVALDLENVDTDQLIPARFMSTPRAEGYGRFLLHDMRNDEGGEPLPAFILNRAPHASVLVSRRNFGIGSSREAAVYALADFGIRAVFAPSFGDIFASNAINNGLLPARVSEETADEIIAMLGDDPMTATIDLRHMSLAIGDRKVWFTLDSAWREKLVNGWDDIDLTLKYSAEIAEFRARRARSQPSAFPPAETVE